MSQAPNLRALPFDAFIALHKQAERDGAPYCTVCDGIVAFPHDHRPDQSGLEDGPWLPGRAPRKKPAPKSAAEMREIRAKAWATRRAEARVSGVGTRENGG